MEIFWIISFWVLSFIIIAPIPVRAFFYISGKVKLPKMVIFDESFASFVCTIGCVGMFGYVYNIPIASQLLWQCFFVFYVIYSVSIIFFSPKIRMLADISSVRKQQIMIVASLIFTMPLTLSLYFYSFGSFAW